MTPVIRPIAPIDASALRAELVKHWMTTQIWSLGRRYDADMLPGFVAEIDGGFAGQVTLAVHDGGWQCEVITLSSCMPRLGIGAALLAAAEGFARDAGCCRIFLTTTNDNVRAMGFYQRHGWRLAALHRGIVDRVRAFKPEYPLVGLDGIEIHDEVEFEKWLQCGT